MSKEAKTTSDMYTEQLEINKKLREENRALNEKILTLTGDNTDLMTQVAQCDVTKYRDGHLQELIISAAVWVQDGIEHAHQPNNIATGFVVTGRRHAHCFYTISLMKDYRLTPKDQGFITTTNRYLDRKEARELAIATGQYHPMDDRPANKDGLFSEDIY